MRALIALALIVMPALGAAGCGKRGDPLPPLQRIPVPANRPRVSQQGHEIVIVWQTPTATLDGGALELEAAEVLRRVVPPPSEAPAPLASGATAEVTSGDATQEEEAEVTEAAQGDSPREPAEPEANDSPPQELADAGDESTEDAGGSVAPSEPEEANEPRVTVSSPRPASFAREAEVIARIACREPGARLEYRDAWEPEWEGMRVEYAVRHINGNGRRSENSNRATIEPLAPLPAPSGLEAVPDNGFVRLTWRGPPEPEARVAERVLEPNEKVAANDAPQADGAAPPEPHETDPETPRASELPTESDPELEGAGEVALDFGFNVYRRRESAASYPLQALNRQLLESASFQDRDVAFGREWCYTVRRVAVRRAPEPTELPPEDDAALVGGSAPPAEASTRENRQTRRGPAARGGGRDGRGTQPPEPPAVIESAGAPDVCLTPIDTFAPAAPEELVALGVPGGILLSWDESDAADLRGYRVYRAERREGPYEPLSANLVEVPSFTDQELTAGKTYFYTVSAVDGAQPPNESPRSEVVDARALE